MFPRALRSVAHPPGWFSTRARLLVAVGALGCSCVMVQLALLREALDAFSGNELVLGVVLGLWMLLMGLGAAVGRPVAARGCSRAVFEWLLMWVALLPLAQVFALRALRNVVFLRGTAVGVSDTVGAVFALLLPYCLPAGCALALGCFLLMSETGMGGIGQGYLADSVGSILGGTLFSFLLVRWFDHLALLVFPASLCLLTAGLLGAQRRGRTRPFLAAGLSAAMLAAVLVTHPDAVSTALQFPGQRVVERALSPYGRLVVTQSGGQITFLENGVALVSSRDTQHVEETVHYAMAQRPQAAKVLLVSGGISGTAEEILKYSVERIDYVELDPLLPGLGRKYLPDNLADGRIRIIQADGRRFIRRHGAEAEKYDVVILDVPPPSTAQLNRFYTAEFLGEVKRVLAPDGVVSFALGEYENYVGESLARMLATAQCSLASSFRHTLLIPGGRVFFLGSDGSLSLEISASLERWRIPTTLVNRHYLDAMLMPDRLADMARAIAPGARPNTDLTPVLYFLHLRHWLSQFEVRIGPLQWALLALLALYLVRLRGTSRALFASGFAGSGIEIVLLLAFQTLCGSVYHQVGVIVTLFMLGLAVGAAVSVAAGPRRQTSGRGVREGPTLWAGGDGLPGRAPSPADRAALFALAVAMAGLSAVLPFALGLLNHWSAVESSEVTIKAVVGLLTFVLAALAGAQFPLANRIEFDTSATALSRLYTADFMGACLGALLASTLIVPLMGIGGLCAVCAGLNLWAALSAAIHLRRAC